MQPLKNNSLSLLTVHLQRSSCNSSSILIHSNAPIFSRILREHLQNVKRANSGLFGVRRAEIWVLYYDLAIFVPCNLRHWVTSHASVEFYLFTIHDLRRGQVDREVGRCALQLHVEFLTLRADSLSAFLSLKLAFRGLTPRFSDFDLHLHASQRRLLSNLDSRFLQPSALFGQGEGHLNGVRPRPGLIDGDGLREPPLLL